MAQLGGLYQPLNESCRHLVATCSGLLDKVEKGGDSKLFVAGVQQATTDLGVFALS